MSLCDYLHDPEHIAEALRVGIPSSLKNLLSDPDLTVRQKSTECLYVIAGHAVGRDAFLEHNIIEPVSQLFNDREEIARKNAHLAIEMISETFPGAEGIVEANLVPILVKKLKTEVDELKEIILDTMHFCLLVNTQYALDAGAMEIFTSLLTHRLPTIRAKAAGDIMHLSAPLDGKNKAVECNTVPALIDLLRDPSADVRANAAGAIMMITITTKGKYTAINAGAIEPLVSLVDDDKSEALTCLSEAPEGRKTLLNQVELIQARTLDPIPAVCKAAKRAVEVITWKP
ncbi:hypothetical protein C0Q70_04942 [Pomacea canaliculata]|uniref:Radial spoke head 14 homolog n=1 Tax=Pomacea canaliculata TaxID=400727 RepID=A0A2T7PJW1_POMCA|nr:hypothetical protein C0Q70_04942 [Pomacea canaliculata]